MKVRNGTAIAFVFYPCSCHLYEEYQLHFKAHKMLKLSGERYILFCFTMYTVLPERRKFSVASIFKYL